MNQHRHMPKWNNRCRRYYYNTNTKERYSIPSRHVYRQEQHDFDQGRTEQYMQQPLDQHLAEWKEPQSPPEVPSHAMRQAIFHLHQVWPAVLQQCQQCTLPCLLVMKRNTRRQIERERVAQISILRDYLATLYTQQILVSNV